MYNYNLNLSIFSLDERLVETIKSIQPLEHFSHNIQRYETFNKDIFENSDIVIYDLDNNEIINSKNQKVIICSNNYDNELNNIESIIQKPFNYKYVKHIIEKILNEISIEEELYYTKSCLNTVIDAIPDMIWIKDINGIHTLLNKEFCKVVGKPKEEVTGKDHYYIWDVSKDDPNSGADLCKQTEDKVIAAGHTLRFTECVKNQKGTRQLITYKSPLYDKKHQVIGTVGIGHDVTDFKNMNVENEILLNSVPYAVLLQDNDGNIQSINNNFETYFKVTKDEIIGLNYEEWTTKTFYPDRYSNEGGYTEGKTHPINGEEKIVELRSENICDIFDNITGKICIFRDVTLERKLEAQIIQNSNIDFMTKLYNRRYLDKYISKIDIGSNLSLLSIDLDHFKKVNDTYGHKMGDKALIMTSNILNECFAKDLVVRMGGDEFLVVKTGTYTIEQLSKEAQSLLDTLTSHFQEKTEFNKVSASVGIAQGILDENGIDTLLQQSDAALYKAKEQGRACYYIYK